MKQDRAVDKKPELMAPAGNWVSLQAALQAGCDAVYFGLQDLSMRANARNFTLDDLPEIVAQCHAAGAKAYLTLNTIVYESELDDIRRIVARCQQADVDAVVAWDFAVIQAARAHGVPVFVSTQMSVSNSESIRFFHETLGIRRFVLARECSLDDIRAIRANVPETIEIEAFVHGAMCISISGRCFLSQFACGASANRGECWQPCRREFLVTDAKDDRFSYRVEAHHVFSPKDICALPFIEKLIEAGIDSFKIEGRSRSPEYVSTVTSAYRLALDFYFAERETADFAMRFDALKAELIAELNTVYNRGFSNGFYLGKPLYEWAEAEGNVATTRKEYVGQVTNFFARPGVAEIKVESFEFGLGDEVLIQGPTTGAVSQIAESIQMDYRPVERAQKGYLIGLKTAHKVRERDLVFVMREVE